MKKYKINAGYPVNERASKSGIKWEYRGKKTFEEAQEMKSYFENSIEDKREKRKLGYCVMIGLRITDTDTGDVIYENLI